MNRKRKPQHGNPARLVPGGVGYGALLRGTGDVARVTDPPGVGALRADANGHKWAAFVVHAVPDPGAAVAGTATFDAESIVEVHLACYRCEQQYSPDVAAGACFDAEDVS